MSTFIYSLSRCCAAASDSSLPFDRICAVFVTAQSLCPSTKRDPQLLITASTVAPFQLSVTMVQIYINIFFKVWASFTLVFVHSNAKETKTRDQSTAKFQRRYSAHSEERICIFVVLFHTRIQWQTAGKVQSWHSGGNSQHSVFETKRDKRHK